MAKKKAVKVQDTDGKWVFFAPIGNLVLTKEIGNEYTLKRVTFISGAKFRRVFKRLRLDKKRLKKGGFLDKRIEPDHTFAFLHHSGKPTEIQRECLQTIRDELDLLSASQLYYRKRRSMCRLGLIGEFRRGVNEHGFLDKNNKADLLGSALADHPIELTLDKQWKEYHKHWYFHRFVSILQGKTNVTSQWAKDITRSVKLVGKSVNSHDIASAFLWNMVALEMLLTRQGDKYSDVIPKRIEALLGWIGYWSTAKFKERIEEVYLLRCKVVHDGRLDLVTPQALLFSEDLLMNVLVNLLRHLRLFRSKDDVINFAELVGAEHLLGQKSRKRPKTLIFVRRNHHNKDYEL